MAHRFLAALAVALVLPAAASAQSPVDDPILLEVDDATEPVTPLRGMATLPVKVTVSCVAAMRAAPATAAAVHLSAEDVPVGFVVTASPSTLLIPHSPTLCAGDGFLRGETRLIVSTNLDAPAFTPTTLVVKARIEGGEEAEDDAIVAAGFGAEVTAEPSTDALLADPGSVATARLTVTGRANANAKLTFSVLDKPDGWGVGVPNAVDLDPAGVDVEFPITPSDVGAFQAYSGTVSVGVKSAYALDPSQAGDNATASFVVTVKGKVADTAERATPTSGALLLLAAAAGAAALVAAPPRARRGRR